MPDQPIPVIDLFAGPGGMGEGFSSVRDKDGLPVFRIMMSVEMERTAHETLRLRAFARKIMNADGVLPKEYLDFLEAPTESNLGFLQEKYTDEWDAADTEAVQGTLKDGDDTYVNMAVERLKGYHGPVVLIGGPPCQAYSLVGRARRTHDKDLLERDVKQTLYKCYLRFIEVIRPTAFVMENVKGLLSAKNFGEGVFIVCETVRGHVGPYPRPVAAPRSKSVGDAGRENTLPMRRCRSPRRWAAIRTGDDRRERHRPMRMPRPPRIRRGIRIVSGFHPLAPERTVRRTTFP